MSKFGFSYPPGAASDPSAPYNEEDGPCEVCLKPALDCLCPECPVCGTQGDPQCYLPLMSPFNGHGLKLKREQVISRAEAEVLKAEAVVAEARLYVEQLRSGGDFGDRLDDHIAIPFGRRGR